jgi:hypothetical protein
MDKVLQLIELILSIIIQLLTYVKDGLGAAYDFLVNFFSNIF